MRLLNHIESHTLENNTDLGSKSESKLKAHWIILCIVQVWSAKIMASEKNNRNWVNYINEWEKKWSFGSVFKLPKVFFLNYIFKKFSIPDFKLLYNRGTVRGRGEEKDKNLPSLQETWKLCNQQQSSKGGSLFPWGSCCGHFSLLCYKKITAFF